MPLARKASESFFFLYTKEFKVVQNYNVLLTSRKRLARIEKRQQEK